MFAPKNKKPLTENFAKEGSLLNAIHIQLWSRAVPVSALPLLDEYNARVKKFNAALESEGLDCGNTRCFLNKKGENVLA